MKKQTLIILLTVFALINSCKKDKPNEPKFLPLPVQSDPILTDNQYKILDAASVDLKVLLDSLKDMNGTPYSTLLLDPNWQTRMDSIKKLHKLDNASIAGQINTDLNTMLTFGFNLCYENSLQSKIRPYVSDSTPAQMAYAYVAGLRQIRVPEVPTDGNVHHKSYKLIGTDCSGFLYLLLKSSGFNIESGLSTSTFANLTSIAVQGKYQQKAELIPLGLLPFEKIRKGDFVIWPDHGGIMQVDGNQRIVYQSNGKYSNVTSIDQLKNFTWRAYDPINPNNRGINPKRLDWMVALNNNGSIRWPSAYKIYRIVPVIDKVEIVSGNNQIGQENQNLTQPLKVKVVDKVGFGIPGVKIIFNISSGNGQIIGSKEVETDDEGFAKVIWQLGTESSGAQTMQVQVQKFDGTNFTGNSIIFNASFKQNKDDLSILRSKTWKLANGPVDFSFNDYLCEEVVWAVLTDAEITFKLETNGKTSAIESLKGLKPLGPNCSFVSESETIKYSSVQLNNNMIQGLEPDLGGSKLAFILRSKTLPDLMTTIVSLNETELILSNNYFSKNLVLRAQ